MNATIKTYPSGSGDCIFFQLEEDAKRYAIMIDCGKYTPEIKAHVENDLEKHINLLIATHIDNDHIDGLVEMFEQTPDVHIDRIFYNCNQNWNGSSQSSEIINQDITALRRLLPSRAVKDSGKIKADKAVTLAEKIAEKDEWWQAWDKEYITTETEPIILDENKDRYGKLTILSPSPDDIKKLNLKFKVEYSRLTKHILENGGSVEGKEKLYELVERVATMKRENYEPYEAHKTGAISNLIEETLLKEAYDFRPEGVTDENGASIALMWEYGDKKVLFMGDAEPKYVATRINDVYGDKQLFLESIKVSHHGSKHSTSHDLMMRVDSDHYFFTGGNLKDKPSLEAIMKIVKRANNRVRILHFNNTDNNYVKALSSEQGKTYCEKYCFVVDDTNEHQFEY